jgi:hypothetical protein
MDACAQSRARVRKLLKAVDPDMARIFTAADAKAAGCTLDDVCWAASRVARNDAAVERKLRHWEADCAARAVVAARDYAEGRILEQQLDAAWAAARDAEEAWQFDRICAWLSDDEPQPWPIPELKQEKVA